MKYDITFLGTCAADFSPRLKGDCADRFDDNARRASCLLFNDSFLIDCGPHCLDSLRIAGIPQGNIGDIFVTHLHGDHYKPETVTAIAKARYDATGEALRFWVSEGAQLPDIPHLDVRYMTKFTEYKVNDTLTVVGMTANHDAASYPQHLLFELDGVKFLYATDGAWFINDTYNYLRKKTLALFVTDGTCGDKEGEWRIGEHNTIPMIKLMLPSLKTVGIIDENTVVCMTHLAPSLHRPHDETVELMSDVGVKVAYDGMKLEI